jgi:hypothetical protein
MFKKTSTLGILSGLLLAAVCAGSAAAETRDGGVALVASAPAVAGDVDAVPARLTITGLDHAFRAQVELEPGASARVSLPAGLYALDAAASLNEGEVIPALSAPKLVVVAAGRVTTVNVNVDVNGSAQAALSAPAR